MLTEDSRHEIPEPLSAAALPAKPKEAVRGCRGSKAGIYLELALAAGAAADVSGGADLLALTLGAGSRCYGQRLPNAFGVGSPHP